MNIQDIKKFDKGNVFKTYEDAHYQIEQIFREFKIPGIKKFKGLNKIIVCGMGGSALGPHFVRSVYANQINIPIIISNEYNLPKWVDNKTLVVISSFSGTTEESISCFNEAKKKKFKTFVICTGGNLSKVKSDKFVYEAKYNYAKNPRFATPYSIACFMALLKSLRLLSYDNKKIIKSFGCFEKGNDISRKVAKSILGKSVVVIGSEHLSGNVHIFNNQINETGKNFSSYFYIPEICHHQFEGLTFPKKLSRQIIYVLLNSNFYHERNKKRYEIMKEILDKKKIKFIEIKSDCKNIFDEANYILGVSSYLSFYLAYLNRIDPQPNPWVDYLKKRIKQ